ncbi:hypothetical protein ASC84_04665 [Acinetobacter sp. Root1280]|uniref:hypothetical protein n=1 Tax=Acinetobacter sp. Root1280 TaxID=1736444 RepID=UPI0006F40FBB|nr:hypothetical protein [Acinetobacter sp. Root1280]KQW98050.1 hypothetical protein ASC84_04665 [Acinetobacter sp. Root1280]
MKLLELAKKNLEDYISIIDTLNFFAFSQKTPIKHVALFLLSQKFQSDIETYKANNYFIVESTDNYDWGEFIETNNTLVSIANLQDPLNLIEEITSEISVLNYTELSTLFWKRSNLYNNEVIKSLNIDWYFYIKDIQRIVKNGEYPLQDYQDIEWYEDFTVRNLLTSHINHSYLVTEIKNKILIEKFVESIFSYFRETLNLDYKIHHLDLKDFLLKNNIIIQSFNDTLLEENKFLPKNIWDESYIYALEIPNNEIDLEPVIDLDIEVKYGTENSYPMYYKSDVFTPIEAACVISGSDPEVAQFEKNYIPWRKANPEFVQAERFINSAVRNQLFDDNEEDDCLVKAEKLKHYLVEKGIIIEGFNDILPKQNNSFGNPTIEHASLEHYQQKNQKLLERIDQLEKEIQRKDGGISLLTIDFNKTTTEIEQLKDKLRLLESEQIIDKSEAESLLDLIFDKSQTDKYAPDLVLAIQLWNALYGSNHQSEDSHGNRSKYWIKANTPYQNESSVEVKRLKEITSPLNGWHIDRKNKFNK